MGYFVGIILIGLFLVLLLGIKCEVIGVIFLVGCEFSLVIIGECYGMDFFEGCGVLVEYLIGILFGVVFIVILVGFLVSFNIFYFYVLVMGVGVGLGSMMVVVVGVVVV